MGSLADLLFTHDLVFCSGGITLHEALAAGTPALVINQVSHQEEKARTAEQFGAAVNLGLAEEFQPQKIEGFLKTPRTCLEKMSRAGKDQVDGKGIFR
ncbi:MAG: hypothetical protein GWM98_21985, partial [Nitrospinaceae bacterium]|nr:hypothetical protein [Nitrospinaceae bacterium]NIR56631.1 hypothetical protein [Nitrospinaceae bacterium]NIS87094.1 hypothetical protein [Nitrospinaceae bacterium]NIT83948.1 hypothetical protein [Nitrospinaceae bacterium]NIU46139.1 hypothetical protein [Nitrospinaceae bacterium]